MKIFKGTMVHTPAKERFEVFENQYVIVSDEGYVEDITGEVPKELKNVTVDYTDKLIIPAYTDLHLHPFQYPLVGHGYDKELLEWCWRYCSPAEALSLEEEMEKKVCRAVIHDLWKYGSLHSVHFPSGLERNTDTLMAMLQKTGMYAYAGKSQSDLPLFSEKAEETRKQSMESALRLAEKYKDSERVRYIFTSGWSLDTSDELMREMREAALAYNAPFQAHLDENRTEVAWSLQRRPDCSSYSQTYVNCNVFGNDIKTVMEHCVHTTEEEIALLRDRGVYVAHCIHSNLDIMSGVMQLRRYLDEGIRVGIGSDISAGHTLNLADCMRAAVQASKMLALKQDCRPVTISEAFYLATMGGGEFFGRVGCFRKGYQFDALVIDDSGLRLPVSRNPEQRIERYLYCGDDRQIMARYVRGEEIKEPYAGKDGEMYEI